MHVLTRKVHSEFAEFITSTPTLEDIANYRLSPESESRISALLEANGEGQLSREDREELDEYLQLEHLMRLAKIRAIEKLAQK